MAIASSSSGEQLVLASTADHVLAVQPRRVPVGDAGEDHAVAVGVEQRQRAGLPSRQLAVGVVADERAVGDRPVEPRLGSGHPVLEVGRDLLDALVQHVEGLLERAGVRDEVLAAGRPEHHGLGRAQAPDSRAEDGERDQRDQRERGRGERGDAGGIREVVHGP